RDDLVTGVQTCALPILIDAVLVNEDIEPVEGGPDLFTFLQGLGQFRQIPRRVMVEHVEALLVDARAAEEMNRQRFGRRRRRHRRSEERRGGEAGGEEMV